MIDEIMEYNRKFVENKGYEPYLTSKYPDFNLYGYPPFRASSGGAGHQKW